MSMESSINGRKMNDFSKSYTLMCLIEEVMSTFSSLKLEDKKGLCDRIDKLFSELFSVERGELVYEDKEYTLDSSKIYIGKLEKITSGFELLFRYLFQKRQQFQRICLKENDCKDYDKEFEMLKNSYNLKPISKEKNYIPYSSGLSNYLGNYNKIDALVFALGSKDVILSMIDKRRVFSNMNLIDSFALIFSVYRIQKFHQKIVKILSVATLDSVKLNVMFRKYLNMVDSTKNEKMFLKTIETVLDSWEEDVSKEEVLLCFHENVWSNLTDFQKKQAVNICNEVIAGILKFNKVKNVKYEYGKNSYDFAKTDDIYVGDITKDKPHEILHKIIYEYSFDKNYENIFKLDPETTELILEELARCEKIIDETQDYGAIRECGFIKVVTKTATQRQNEVYNYISNNLVIGGKKIKMNIKKNNFILDLYKSKPRR